MHQVGYGRSIVKHAGGFSNETSERGLAIRRRMPSCPTYSGMFPCFLRGMVSTLFANIRSARITFGRVSRGSITSSINPRSAATNGLAKRSWNSSIFCLRAAALSSAAASSRRYTIFTAPSAPMTAISAVGYAKFTSVRRCFEPITQVRAAVGFARDDGDLRDGGFRIGI